jgi:serine/threonine protein kinase
VGIFNSIKNSRLLLSIYKPNQVKPVNHLYITPKKWEIGDKINNQYQITRILGGPGKSGMGIVYICNNLETGSTATIKTLQDKYLVHHAFLKRFLWEAEAWVLLDRHENIARLYFISMIEGRPYLFMENIEGSEKYGNDLAGWIQKGGLTHSLVLDYAIQFCHGMMHAEKKFRELGRTFVHRDIKPSNILITGYRAVKIADFGLVKAYAESDFTRYNFPVSSSSDSSLLGLSKSGSICGTPPYMSPEQCRGELDTDIRSDIYSFGCVLYEMVMGSPPFKGGTLEHFIFHHLNTTPLTPFTDDALAGIIMKCLEKNPANRYPDFTCLEQALAEIYTRETGRVIRMPVAPQPGSSDLANKGVSLDELGFHQESLKYLLEAIRLNPGYCGNYLSLGVSYYNLGNYDESVKRCKQALDICPDYQSAHFNLGLSYTRLEKYSEALAEFETSARLKPDNGHTYCAIGCVYQRQGKTAEAITALKKALELNQNDAVAHFMLGHIYWRQNKLNVALKELEEAIAINPHDVETCYYHALVLEDCNKPVLALEEWKRYLNTAPPTTGGKSRMATARKQINTLEQKLNLKP